MLIDDSHILGSKTTLNTCLFCCFPVRQTGEELKKNHQTQKDFSRLFLSAFRRIKPLILSFPRHLKKCVFHLNIRCNFANTNLFLFTVAGNKSRSIVEHLKQAVHLTLDCLCPFSAPALPVLS